MFVRVCLWGGGGAGGGGFDLGCARSHALPPSSPVPLVCDPALPSPRRPRQLPPLSLPCSPSFIHSFPPPPSPLFLSSHSRVPLLTPPLSHQRGFRDVLVQGLDRQFDDVVAMVAGLRSLDRSSSRAQDYNQLLVDLVWDAQVHRRAPLFRPAVAAAVSEADDVGTEVAPEGAWAGGGPGAVSVGCVWGGGGSGTRISFAARVCVT
jgi:hypothetical protein